MILVIERVSEQRPFPRNFDTSSPNLIVTEQGTTAQKQHKQHSFFEIVLEYTMYIPTGKVFVTVLAMYMAEQSFPMPTFEEVLVCTPSTTFEEVCPLHN